MKTKYEYNFYDNNYNDDYPSEPEHNGSWIGALILIIIIIVTFWGVWLSNF